LGGTSWRLFQKHNFGRNLIRLFQKHDFGRNLTRLFQKHVFIIINTNILFLSSCDKCQLYCVINIFKTTLLKTIFFFTFLRYGYLNTGLK
jgi:hypothetical protein